MVRKGRDEEQQTDLRLIKALTDLRDNLIENQESLGEEFQKVLFDNLWDMYEE